ncbi:MAG: 4'-phosphopantetheinyl transferase superfamily protein [Taibaiella sp.]|nr:4'-phosphopantetheinyl transferase superfamily protein [Taibaiella sp.]
MPIYQHFLHQDAEVAIWKIEEPESFFQESTGLVSFIRTEKRRIEYYAGRYVLAHMIPGLDLSTIRVDHIGKPYLPDGRYHFSISHSFPYIAVAIHTAQPIGIDIQVFKPKILKLSEKFLHQDEYGLIRESVATITLLWCAKEAMFKWRGTGGQDFSEQLRILRVHSDERLFEIDCTIIDPDLKNNPLSLLGKIEDDFALAVGTAPIVL